MFTLILAPDLLRGHGACMSFCVGMTGISGDIRRARRYKLHQPRPSHHLDLNPLLQRIAAGDRQAYAEVVRHFQRPLFGFLARMGLSPARIEELAQDTFTRAWLHLPEHQPARAQFSTWLYTIAHRLALNELARASSHREVPARDDTPEPACEQPGPADLLRRRRRQARLQQALRTLSTEDRSVLALAYVHELDMADIARIEACTPAAVRTRLYRARQRLRVALGPDLESDHDN